MLAFIKLCTSSRSFVLEVIDSILVAGGGGLGGIFGQTQTPQAGGLGGTLGGGGLGGGGLGTGGAGTTGGLFGRSSEYSHNFHILSLSQSCFSTFSWGSVWDKHRWGRGAGDRTFWADTDNSSSRRGAVWSGNWRRNSGWGADWGWAVSESTV